MSCRCPRSPTARRRIRPGRPIFEFELSKRITADFGVSIKETLIRLVPRGDTPRTGVGNLELGGEVPALHERAPRGHPLAGPGRGAGRHRPEGPSAPTRSPPLTPALLYGKGFGDLPEPLAYLKPLALTGVIGVDLPTRAKNVLDTGDVEGNPHVLQWGFALEYSLPYLQSNVKDLGLPAPFRGLTPVVELSLHTPLDRGQGGKTTGTVNPGLLWSGGPVQISLEAMIPINARSGPSVGVIGQLHFYLDDLFPRLFGKAALRREVMSALGKAVLALSLLLAAASVVAAHALLERADPRVGSSVPASPAQVRLWFSERIEPAFSSVQVLDAAGKRVDTGTVQASPFGTPSNYSSPCPHSPRAPTGCAGAWCPWIRTSPRGDFAFRVAP